MLRMSCILRTKPLTFSLHSSEQYTAAVAVAHAESCPRDGLIGSPEIRGLTPPMMESCTRRETCVVCRPSVAYPQSAQDSTETPLRVYEPLPP